MPASGGFRVSDLGQSREAASGVVVSAAMHTGRAWVWGLRTKSLKA